VIVFRCEWALAGMFLALRNEAWVDVAVLTLLDGPVALLFTSSSPSAFRRSSARLTGSEGSFCIVGSFASDWDYVVLPSNGYATLPVCCGAEAALSALAFSRTSTSWSDVGEADSMGDGRAWVKSPVRRQRPRG